MNMTYDWTKHLSNSTIEGRAVEGGGGGGRVVPSRNPKGFIKLNTGITYVIESLGYFERDELSYLYDLLMWIEELDVDWPFLTVYNRKEIRGLVAIAQRNSEAAALDLNDTEDMESD